MGGSSEVYGGGSPMLNNYGWDVAAAEANAPKGEAYFAYMDKSRSDWIAKATAGPTPPAPPPPPPPPEGVAEAPVGSKATSVEAAKARAAQNKKGSSGTGQSSSTPSVLGGAEESIVALAPNSLTSRIKTLLGM